MSSSVDKTRCLKMYEQMLTIRRFEERAHELFQQNLMRGFIHSSVGQEAVSVGVCSNLRRDDFMSSTHRGHGHCIAKGADPKLMMAELLGKSTGYCKGKGGSLHIADFEGGNLGANGIVGGGIPVVAGAGITIQNRGTDQVAVCFFGDGASNQGTFHETINLSALWKLPVIFVCENNFYALSTPVKESVSAPHISDRAKGYGIPGLLIDGMDVLEVYSKTAEAIGLARAGQGPALLECVTYRFYGHHVADPGKGTYRTREEVDQWLQRCPIETFRKRLMGEKILTEEIDHAIETRVKSSIEEAVRFALESPFPLPEEATKDIFC